MYECVCVCVHSHVHWHSCEVGGQLLGVLPFLQIGPRDRTQVVGIANKRLYSLALSAIK